jgi:hypothetical protein
MTKSKGVVRRGGAAIVVCSPLLFGRVTNGRGVGVREALAFLPYSATIVAETFHV